MKLKISDVINALFDKRYPILCVLFILLVCFDVNFSSIHMWNIYVSNDKPAFMLGVARDIRSDEWATNLSWQMSQVFNNFGTYNYMSRASGLNTLIAQFQAGWNIENIGRPANWGFLMLGAARGLSWYWCSKIILLFLSSIEFIYLLTKNKKLSLAGAFVITYAPGLQWWFSNYLPDLITSFQFILVLLVTMIHQKNLKCKLLNTFGLIVFSVGFVFVIYPPWQIPLLYIMLVFIVTILMMNRPSKLDYSLITLVLFINVICIWHFYLLSHQDIEVISNTIYPGKRFSHSGESNIGAMFNYLNNLTTPYKSANYLNDCELSNFWLFFPVFPFICFYIPSLKRGVFYNILLYANMIIFVYLLIPDLGNDLIYKYTLLSNVTGHRLELVFGLLNTYLLILFLDKYEIAKAQKNTLRWVNGVVWVYVAIYLYKSQIYNSMSMYLWVSIALMWLIIDLILNNRKSLVAVMLVLLAIISGAVVNPLVVGIGDLYNSSLSHKIQEIRKQNLSAVWVSSSWILGEYLLDQGVYSFNSVKFYPDFKVWSRLDPNGSYINVYNRFAHIDVGLNSESSSINLIQADLFNLNLNREDLLKNTDIKYILSNDKLINMNNVILLDSIDRKYIYEVIRK